MRDPKDVKNLKDLKNKPGNNYRSILIWLIIITVISYMFFQYYKEASAPTEMSFTEFEQEVADKNVKSVVITADKIEGELIKSGSNKPQNFTTRNAYYPEVKPLIDMLKQNDVVIHVKSANETPLWFIIAQYLPIVLIVLFFFMLFRQSGMGGGGHQAFSFGRSKAKLWSSEKKKVTFNDVAGVEEAIEELKEVVDFLKDPQKYKDVGARIPKGVLLLGAPGTGKTLLGRAIAGEAGVPFFYISGSDFVEMFVGVGASITGDTPVLIQEEEKIRLITIGEFVDKFYDNEAEGFTVPVKNIKTLGFDSDWKEVKRVFRHKADEIYEIEYPGGKIKTTGDHSVFIRKSGRIMPVETRNLKQGDVLVEMPEAEEVFSKYKVVQMAGISQTSISYRQEGNNISQTRNKETAIITNITKKKYDGFVYDLCGVENEAFFGGEKPVLFHNSRVRDTFEQAKKNSPCIIFIDEIDAVGRQRGAGLGGGHDEREQTLNQLLVEMDGFEVNSGVILIAATNRPDVLDPALLRPGRFDRNVIVDKPDIKGREAILKVHSREKPLDKNVDLSIIAKRTVGFSGADLENLLNEAALLAARSGEKTVKMEFCEESIDRVLMGPERKSRIISEKEKNITAYHEAGHALVAKLLPEADPVRKVTILPRGMALGITWHMPEEDKYMKSKNELLAEVKVLLGGRVAESIVFGEMTTGASNDLKVGTEILHRMVCKYGMSEKLGPLTFGKSRDQIFLGRDMFESKDYSDETARQIDSEVRQLVDVCFNETRELLMKNKEKLEKLVVKLKEKEILEGYEIDIIINGKAESGNLPDSVQENEEVK
ncbi:MAG: ATP-dependent metallopeptidase FtsH/Yme1/Tma family protein [Armatimonadota bacterium]